MSDQPLHQPLAFPTLTYSPYSIDSKDVDPLELECDSVDKTGNRDCRSEPSSPDEKCDLTYLRKGYARRASVWTINSLRQSFSLTDIPKRYQLSPYRPSRILPLLEGDDTQQDALKRSLQLGDSEKKFVPPLLLVGPVVVILMTSAGMATLILLWIFWHKLPLQSPGVIYLREGDENEIGRQYSDSTMGDDKRLHFNEMSSHPTTLSLSSVVVFLIGWSLYPMMGLIAYGLAADWLRIQEGILVDDHSEGHHAMLTPTHYALISRICGANDMSSIYDGVKYWATQRRKASGIPSMLKKGIIWLLALLTLQISIAWLDFTLHETTRTVSAINVDEFEQMLPYSMAINETLCPSNRTDPLPCLYTPSSDLQESSVGSFAFNDPLVVSQGWLVANQESEQYSVRMHSGQAAQKTISEIAFYTHPKMAANVFLDDLPSIGLSSQCDMVTDQCQSNSTFLDCGNIGRPELVTSSWQADVLYSLDAQGTARTINGQLGAYNNPFQISGLMQWTQLYRQSSATLLRDTSMAGQYGAFVCELTLFDLTLSYFNDTYSIETSTIADINLARDLSGPLLAGMLTNSTFASVSLMEGKFDNGSFAVRLASSLSFNVLAFSAGLLVQRDTKVRSWRTILAQQYDIGILVVYVALLYLYAMTALLLFFWAWATSSRCIVYQDEDGVSKEMPMVVLTQRLLMDPSTHLIANCLKQEKEKGEGLLLARGDTSDDEVGALQETCEMREKQTKPLERIFVGLNESGRSFGVWPLPRRRSSALPFDD